MEQATPDPQTFTTQELLACVPGLSLEVLKVWLNRGNVVLSDRTPVGKGKRRAYSAEDVLQVAAIFEMVRQGLMVSKSLIVWQVVQGRLRGLEFGLGTTPVGSASALFCLHPVTGELVARSFDETQDDPLGLNDEDAPDFAVLFRMDRFIERVCARMDAVKTGKPIPPPPDPTRNENPDPDRRWDKDAEGRTVLTGLTAEETAEYERTSNADAFDCDARDRYFELHDKHEAARIHRLMNEGRS